MKDTNQHLRLWRIAARLATHPFVLSTVLWMAAVAVGVSLVSVLVEKQFSLVRLLKTVYFSFFVVYGLGISFVAMKSIALGLRFYGTGYFRNLPIMWRLAAERTMPATNLKRVSIRVSGTVGLAMVLIGAAVILTGAQWAPFVGVPLVVIAISYLSIVFFTYGQTPVVLVLGVSSEKAISLQAEIQTRFSREIGPVGTVTSLLNLRSLDGPDRDVAAFGGSQRTNFDTWRKVARSFVGMVRVIVIDARTTSNFLEEEISWIVRNGLAHRCLLLAGEESDIPGETLKRDAGFRRVDSVSSLLVELAGRLQRARRDKLKRQ